MLIAAVRWLESPSGGVLWTINGDDKRDWSNVMDESGTQVLLSDTSIRPPRNAVSMRTHLPSRRNSRRGLHQTRGRVDVASTATCKCPRNTGRSSPLDAATIRVVYKPSVPVAAKPKRCGAHKGPARRRMKPKHEVPAAMDGGSLDRPGAMDGTGRQRDTKRCSKSEVGIRGQLGSTQDVALHPIERRRAAAGHAVARASRSRASGGQEAENQIGSRMPEIGRKQQHWSQAIRGSEGRSAPEAEREPWMATKHR